VEISRCDEELDEFLLTVILIARYKTTMNQPENLKSKNSGSALYRWSHHDGAMAILRV
jgi:hypothetical protein